VVRSGERIAVANRGFASDLTSKIKEETSKSQKPTQLSETKGHETVTLDSAAASKEPKHKKTMEQLDEELKLKLEGISGEGGNAGVEYEGGKAVGLKRGVKENMFRVI